MNEKVSPVSKALYILSTFIFFVMLLLVSLRIIVSAEGLTDLAYKFIKDNSSINEDYFEPYYDNGFSTEMCYELFEGDLQKLTAEVMGDKMSVLFHYSNSYLYTEEECEGKVLSILEGITDKHQLEVDALDLLVQYTMDVSGISSIYIYNSPAAYRESVFSNSENEVVYYEQILQGLAVMVKGSTIFAFVIMYIICTLLNILFLRHSIKNIIQLISNTIIYPSIAILAISFGQKFCFQEVSLLQNYIFGWGIITSAISLLIGIGILLIGWKIIMCKKGRDHYESERGTK